MKTRFIPIILIAFSLALSCSKDDETPTDLAEAGIEAEQQSVEEGESASFLISLSERLDVATTLTLSFGGTATLGEDYENLSTTVTIPAQRLNVSINVQTLEDQLSEGDEELIISLAEPDIPGISLGTSTQVSLTITDPPPAFRPGPSEVRSYMVNPNATEETAALFYHLKALSETKFVIGQQDAFSSFYGNNTGDSDIKKTTGSDPGLLGLDFMFITDDLNDETPNNWFYQQEQNIIADAVEAYDKGMINAFTWHLREPYEGKDFYTANMTTHQKENAFKSILPGGANHEYYKQKLDKVASVAKSMIGGDGKLVPFIFRPFHEFDGHWFWWGKDYCTAQEFITVWRFTVEYLRDEKQVNNMLFAYSPDNSFTSEAAYLNRYPGDAYVDILGMDNYGDLDNMGMEGVARANAKLQIVSNLALERVKIAAMTETCYFVTPGQNNPIPNFYSQNLYQTLTDNGVEMAFMMFWSNGETTYCTPPPGQAGTTDFTQFVNKPRSALADDLPDIYSLPGSG